MRFLLLLIFSTRLYGVDAPVNYWSNANENPIPKYWQSFLDPNSLNFWKEGDYTPPLPQIWAMRDPSPQNIALYKTYLKRRAEVLEKFQIALKKDRIEQIEKIIIAFRSDCSACHQLLSELSSYQNINDKIQLLQIDQRSVSLPWPIVRISESQANTLNIQMVPTIWVKKQGGRVIRLEHPSKLFEEYL